MPLNLDPEMERQVLERAQDAGMNANDYIAGMLRATAPDRAPDPVARVRSLLSQWQRQDATPVAPPGPNDGTLTPSEALFRRWEQEDAGLSEDARRAEEDQ
jgi:hypothetical protein